MENYYYKKVTTYSYDENGNIKDVETTEESNIPEMLMDTSKDQDDILERESYEDEFEEEKGNICDSCEKCARFDNCEDCDCDNSCEPGVHGACCQEQKETPEKDNSENLKGTISWCGDGEPTIASVSVFEEVEMLRAKVAELTEELAKLREPATAYPSNKPLRATINLWESPWSVRDVWDKITLGDPIGYRWWM